MKKTLLAAALFAGFAGVAQAETSVTLYGLIDTGIGYNRVESKNAAGNKVKGTRVGAITGTQSGSRWGLRGSEDLGDGLRAVFVLESGFNSGNGNSGQDGRLFGRQATVGLASDSWGRFDLGRQTNIASKYFADIDPFGAGFDQANIGMSIGSGNNVSYDNMALYQTPSFSGFQFGIGYAFNADDKNGLGSGWRTANNDRAFTTGLRYANGPLTVALSYDSINGSNGRGGDVSTPRVYAIGGAYDFEVVKLSLAYARTTGGWIGGVAANGFSDVTGGPSLPKLGFADDFRANSYLVGLSAPIGAASNVFGSWQHVSVGGGDNKGAQLTGGKETMNVYSLGYTYDLSKRTNVYAYGSYASDYAFINEAKSTAVGVGLRHRF